MVIIKTSDGKEIKAEDVKLTENINKLIEILISK